jgi:hypothetical protein
LDGALEVRTTAAAAEKCKWKSAIEARAVTATTKEQKTAEASGKHWFIMTCTGMAFKYGKMHAGTGCTFNIWQELQERFNNVKLGDLQDLYKWLTDTVATGPEDDDPKLGSRKSKRPTRLWKRQGGT